MPTQMPTRPASMQRAGRTALAGVELTGAAVAACVHAGGERQRPLEGVLHHRDHDAAQPTDAAAGHARS